MRMNDIPDNPGLMDLVRLLMPIRPMIPREAFLEAVQEQEKIRA